MPDRIDTVTTGSGDKGSTSLADGNRYYKHDPLIELVGVLDEANAALGLVSVLIDTQYKPDLVRLQSRLFDVGASIATGFLQEGWPEELDLLDSTTRILNRQLEPLKEFLLPGSNEISARIHIARTTLRRAERIFWQAASTKLRDSSIGAYLNRASDYLFVLSRTVSDREVLWQPMSR